MESTQDSRYIIGIDLGTSNSAVYYVDTEKNLNLRHFKIPQLTAAGETSSAKLLPSFTYLPGNEITESQKKLPWETDSSILIGTYARDQGSQVPNRLISSTKSWLSHSGVDRSTAILPWGSDIESKYSPVHVTAFYLNHIREAWNHKFGHLEDADGTSCTLENQQVIITIPASFDSTARELTIRAAEIASYKNLTLLEEPLAAFYAWLNIHDKKWDKIIAVGEKILVVDVGGGTTDFSIIEMDSKKSLHRYAVGEHLLLGGDNIDMTIARAIEKEWGKKLPHDEWTALQHSCREAKETLLTTKKQSVTITLLSKGSSVIASAKSADVTKEQVLEILNEGFFPELERDAKPPKKQTAIRQMGLPYASDPAISKHLLQFLKHAAAIAHNYDESIDPDQPLAIHKLLFNGGTVIPSPIRTRIKKHIRSWTGQKIEELDGEDFSLAVAAGAAYYGRVRRGQGVKVKGGIAHAYYLETVDAKGETAYICVMPRDTDESIDQVIDTQFKLKTNQQVVFRLFSSATRLNDKLGELISDDEELNSVAPMISALKFGKTDIREIDAGISSRLTEVGSLQIFLNSKESEHQWPLAFDLRPIQDSNQELGVIVDEEKQISALNYIEYVFKGDHERTLKTINAALETIIGLKREKWSISLLRRIVDKLLEIEDLRMKSEDHESRWLNLLGYCLRPGFGDPGDELRMRHVWKLWFNGTVFDKKQCICEWWVFIRRVSPGLTEGQQGTIANALMKIIMPKNIYRTDIKEGSQAQMEMWHCLGSLELISKRQKTKILNLLMERGNKIEAWELWVVARLATRRLFRGPANLVVKVDDAWSCVEKLRKLKFKDERKQSMLNFAISRIAAKSGDRALDIDDKQLATVKKFLEGNNAAVSWIRELDSTGERDAKSLAKMLADTLPVGLSLG